MQDQRKGSRKQIQIAEALIDILAENGIENLTYGMISKKCKIARSLIYHYFPELADLLIFTSTYIRYHYQLYVIEKMKNQKSPRDLLRAYVISALEWLDDNPRYTCTWIIFFHQCSVSEDLAAHNRSLVDMGVSRLSEMIRLGIKTQQFKISDSEVGVVARQIQLLITGGVVSRSTEKRAKKYWTEEAEKILELSLKMLNA